MKKSQSRRVKYALAGLGAGLLTGCAGVQKPTTPMARLLSCIQQARTDAIDRGDKVTIVCPTSPGGMALVAARPDGDPGIAVIPLPGAVPRIGTPRPARLPAGTVSL